MDTGRLIHRVGVWTLTAAGCVTMACVRPTPPEVADVPPPPPPPVTASRPSAPPPRPTPPPPPPPPPSIGAEDELSSRSLEELNRESPLEPVFFLYDSAELDITGRGALEANADILREYPSWVITIEGHCDERGTPEYNLGLGERRALTAREYLVSLGLQSDRIRTVSYGKEFPFAPGGDEDAWSRNRRAHFVITER